MEFPGHFTCEMSVCVELSSQGFKEAAALDEQFVFVVDGVEYQCCRFQACLVSGLVRRLMASDCCLSRLSLKVSDPEEHFNDVVSLMNGQKISITESNAAFLEACARELENEEILRGILGFQLEGDVSMSNVVDRICIKRQLHRDYKSEIDFLSSHFFEVKLDVLTRLSVSDLELILANPLLRLDAEDQLYDAIMSLPNLNDDDRLVLLRYVEFAFLSEPKLCQFLGCIFPGLVAHFWGPLCECVRQFCITCTKTHLMKSHRYNTPKPPPAAVPVFGGSGSSNPFAQRAGSGSGFLSGGGGFAAQVKK